MYQAPATAITAVTTWEIWEMDVAPPELKKASVTTLCRARPRLKGVDTEGTVGIRTEQGW